MKIISPVSTRLGKIYQRKLALALEGKLEDTRDARSKKHSTPKGIKGSTRAYCRMTNSPGWDSGRADAKLKKF